MNLLELIPKNDPNILVQSRAAAAGPWSAHPDPKSLMTKIGRPVRRLDGSVLAKGPVRGLVLRPGMRVVFRRASTFFPNFAEGQGLFQFGLLSGRQAKVELAWSHATDAPAARVQVPVGADVAEVAVPAAPAAGLDLVISVPGGQDAEVFFGVHRVLDRNELYKLCKGTGVEVGPGPKPQILPGPDVEVQYVEQATPDEWQRLYGKDTKTPVDPALWNRYVVGNADRIPAAPGTLDFIFSSHVVEHLANPLGHLAYWGSLLKPGGVVAAVIPDMQGCKDYVFQPSTAEEIEQEYRRGAMTPTLEHYRRWCAVRAPASDPAQVLAAGRSIHVHFYTPETMRALLRQWAGKLGFASSEVFSNPNHKDFHVLLRK